MQVIKHRLKVNKTTFLQHGSYFTIIKKELSNFDEAIDICFRPPIILKNCLPVPLVISYTDSNGN